MLPPITGARVRTGGGCLGPERSPDLPETPALRSQGKLGGMSTSLSAALSPIALPDPDGREVRLGSLWEKRPAAVVFLRHYG